MFDFEKYIQFTIYSIREMRFWLCKNCRKFHELENHCDLYAPALGPFNYHIKGQCRCLCQFLINLMLSISIWQIFEVLKQCLYLFGYMLYLISSLSININIKLVSKKPKKDSLRMRHSSWKHRLLQLC